MSVKSSQYREKIAHLRNELNKAEGLLGSEKCIPTMTIAAVVVPVLIFLVLFFLSPRFVQRKEGSKYIRCLKKVFLWTVILSIILWVTMYLYTYYKNYNGSLICSV